MSKIETDCEGFVLGYEVKNNEKYLIIDIPELTKTCCINITALDSSEEISEPVTPSNPPPNPPKPIRPSVFVSGTVLNSRLNKMVKTQSSVLRKKTPVDLKVHHDHSHEDKHKDHHPTKRDVKHPSENSMRVDVPGDNHEHKDDTAHYSKHIFNFNNLGVTEVDGKPYYLFEQSYETGNLQSEYLLFSPVLKNILELLEEEEAFIEKDVHSVVINPSIDSITEANIVNSLVKKSSGIRHDDEDTTS